MKNKSNDAAIAQFYNLESAEYAQKFHSEIETKQYDQYILKQFLSLVGNDELICEVGCGPAQVLKYCRSLQKKRAVGVDIARSMLHEAQRIDPGSYYVNGTMLSLPFKPASVAGVIAFYAIVHNSQEELSTIFSELYRILKPDGILVLCFHTGSEIVKITKNNIEIDYIMQDYESIHSRLQLQGFDYLESIVRKPYIGIEYPSNRGYILTKKR